MRRIDIVPQIFPDVVGHFEEYLHDLRDQTGGRTRVRSPCARPRWFARHDRDGRIVIASSVSAMAKIRAPSGISSPFRPRGYPGSVVALLVGVDDFGSLGQKRNSRR